MKTFSTSQPSQDLQINQRFKDQLRFPHQISDIFQPTNQNANSGCAKPKSMSVCLLSGFLRLTASLSSITDILNYNWGLCLRLGISNTKDFINFIICALIFLDTQRAYMSILGLCLWWHAASRDSGWYLNIAVPLWTLGVNLSPANVLVLVRSLHPYSSYSAAEVCTAKVHVLSHRCMKAWEGWSC